MRFSRKIAVALSTAFVLLAFSLRATDVMGTQALPMQTGRAVRLCRVRLVSETEPDMTSVDSILKSIIKPGMTDEQKCMAVYRLVHRHRFWAPSSRPVENGQAVADPVVILNCFPALICQQDASVTSAFWAGLGYDVRYWQLKGHTSGEVFYGGKWRNFDATFGRYKRDKTGGIADVSIAQGMYKPGISSVTPWDDYEIGHRMDITLRRGETFTRYWHPLSKSRDYWRPGGNGRMPGDRGSQRRSLAATMRRKPYRFDTKGAGFSNGLWVFKPVLSDERWADVFESARNVAADTRTGLLRPKTPGRPAELIWRVRTPYIITGAWVEGDFLVPGPAGDGLKAFVSANNGATWKEIGPVKPGKQKLSLRKIVGGKFSYLVKLSMKGETPRAVGVRNLACTTVVQVNPLSLPALKLGENRIQLSAGEQTETLTIYPNLETPDYRAEVIEESNTATAREQLQAKWLTGLCARQGGKESSLVYKVTAPGPIKRVRWGGRFRTGKDCFNEMHYSTDRRTWHKQEWSRRWTFPGSKTPNMYIAVNETTQMPAGPGTVFLKYRFKRPEPRNDPVELHIATAIRIDVDYVPPGRSGAFPVEVTYCWTEGGGEKTIEKTHTEIARTRWHSYNIDVQGEEKPLIKWVRMRIVSP